MINQKNMELGKKRSSIRELFEYGKQRKAQIGAENVHDFSIGNPSVPAPQAVHDTLIEIVNTYDPVALHGYTSAQGDATVRATLANYINQRFQTALTADCLYLTCGAAASLTITLNALLNAGDQVITFAPFFPEYKVFTERAGGTLVPVAVEEGTFQIDEQALRQAMCPEVKAVLINSPNNPSGVVYTLEKIQMLCRIVREYSQRYGHTIFIISDEPYRELVFDENVKVPYIMNEYEYSLVCYSYSKSLSLPGERIGYIAVNNQMAEWQDVYAAICGAGRSLGFVCAPNLFQQLIGKIYNVTADISIYKRNRDRLSEALRSMGYFVVQPDGAFYLFVKSLEADSRAFCARAKKYELLLVAGDDFGAKGYVRISYCVSPEMIERALPAFEALAKEYQK